jgi:hypothetical protein
MGEIPERGQVGYTLQSRHISFEAGGAYYFFQRNNVSGQEAPFNPGAPGSYTGDDRVWSAPSIGGSEAP